MKLATKRLRRAGIAGLATVATVGGLVLGTGGTAFAWDTAASAVTVASTPTTVPAGSTAAAGSDITFTLPNKAWNVGDQIKLTIIDANNGATTANTIKINGTPTATVSLASGAASTDTKPAVSLGLSATAASISTIGAKDTITLTITNDGNNSADAKGAPVVTLSGLKFDVGTQVDVSAGGKVQFALASAVGAGAGEVAPTFQDTASNAITSVAVANIAATTISVAGSVGTTVNSTITVPTITVTDVTGLNAKTSIVFTLTATDLWKTSGTLTGPSGVTIGAATGTGTNALTFPISGVVPTNAVFTLTGATATTGAAVAKSQTVTATSNAGATTFGAGATQFAFVAAPTRIGGIDRYATAALVYEQKYSAAGSAVLATGANFPDALSATVLAKAKTTGVLLTDPNSLSSATKQVLISDGPANVGISTVYVVGGPAAITDAVVTQIQGLKNAGGNSINVVRVYGADRYATNAAVDLQAGVTGTIGGGNAIVATGENFPDALAVGPALYATGWPLILTPSADLNATAKSTISALGIANAVIVGGPNAVSATAEASLKTAGVTVTNRLAGADRTQTAVEIAKWELSGVAPAALFAETGYPGTQGLGFSGALVHIARGDNYPDALVSGAWLGNVKEVLLLTASPTSLGSGIPALLKGSVAAYNTSNINAIGLAAAVSTPTVMAAVGAIS